MDCKLINENFRNLESWVTSVQWRFEWAVNHADNAASWIVISGIEVCAITDNNW